MLDIQFIRENKELVREKSKQKGIDIDVEQLLGFDTKRRELLGKVENVRRQRNQLTESIKGQRPIEEQVAKGRELKDQLTDLEHQLSAIEQEFLALLKQVPNMPLDDVPVGTSEEANQVIKEWGTKKDFDFQPKTHWELAEARGLIDKERAAKVSGTRFAYIKGGLVDLHFAIIQYVLKTLRDEQLIERIIKDNNWSIPAKPFTPILPPALVKTEAYEATARLDAEEVTYKLADDDLWLNASAEHSLANMYLDEILTEEQLPIRYIGYATSFRREAGSYGKDTEGIIRMHQFDKLEMEVFSTPEHGLEEHQLLIALQQYMVQQLELPYRVLQKCTADIGKPNARGIDIEIWMPGQDKYRETHTADYMTDYQARRLKTRFRRRDGSVSLVHTNDATAFALGRLIVAIIENNQTHDGHIIIPEILHSYMNGKEEL